MDLHDSAICFQLYSLLPILLPFPSYFWYLAVLAITEDWIGINLNYLLQLSLSTEFELTAYNFIKTHIRLRFHLPYFILLCLCLHKILSVTYCLGTDITLSLFASLLFSLLFIYMENLERFVPSIYMPFQNHILNIQFISWISSCRSLWNTWSESLYYGKKSLFTATFCLLPP